MRLKARWLLCPAGGWLPWLHEIVPEKERGTYFGAEVSVAHCVSVFAMLVLGFTLEGDPSLTRFLAIYGFGLAAGFASVYFMSRVPGGGDRSQNMKPATGRTQAIGASFVGVGIAFARFTQDSRTPHTQKPHRDGSSQAPLGLDFGPPARTRTTGLVINSSTVTLLSAQES